MKDGDKLKFKCPNCEGIITIQKDSDGNFEQVFEEKPKGDNPDDGKNEDESKGVSVEQYLESLE